MRKAAGFISIKVISLTPQRLSTLIIAACLAYMWIIHLGLEALRKDWVKVIHRSDRCDWSLFHLGLALLDHFLMKIYPFRSLFLS